MMLFAKLSHKKLSNEIEVRNLTQEQFAEQIGISDRHIRNLTSRDIDVSASLLFNISQAFQIPMEDMLVMRQEHHEE